MRGGSQQQSLVRGLEAFKEYVAIKLHFNGERNYNPSLKFNQDTLAKRKDARHFIRAAEFPDYRDRFVSLLYKTPTAWIGSVFDDEATENHKARLMALSGLSYTFRKDVQNIRNWMDEHGYTLKDAFTPSPGSPRIVCSVIPGGVRYETLALLDSVFHFCEKESNDPLWERRRILIAKYAYWLDVGRQFLFDQCDMLVQQSAATGVSPIISPQQLESVT